MVKKYYVFARYDCDGNASINIRNYFINNNTVSSAGINAYGESVLTIN